MTKINVTALQTVSHGNLDMKEGKVYTMSKGEAQALEKAGFVKLQAEGEPEGVLGEQVAQKKQPGDVTVDDEEDLLGDGEKEAPAVENKMEKPAANKSTAKK
jgi:hypothetical protein